MFELYKKKLGYGEQKSYDYGKMLRSHNNEISNQSFEYDAAYIKCLINGETVDAKYFYGSAGDVNKDEPRYNLQFRSGVHYPIGSIVSIEEELQDNDWISFNHTILNAYGIDAHYESICNSLKSMRKARRAAKEKYEIKVKQGVNPIYYRQSPNTYSMAAEPNNNQ